MAGQSYESRTLDLQFNELGKHTITAQVWDPEIPGTEVETSITVFVSEVPKPIISIKAPKKVELGLPFAATANVLASYGTPVGYWTLPDGTKADGATLNYTPAIKTDDLRFTYTAYILGYPETTVTAQSSSIKVDAYEMPQFKIKSFQKLDGNLYAPYGVFFGVTGDATKASEFGVPLTHRWDFGDGTIIEGAEPKRAGHIYTDPGVYTITLSVFDNRGNVSTDSLEISVLGPPPVVVESFKIVPSNKFNRAPLSVSVRPKVTGGHPQLDRISSYGWTVNGEPVEGRNFVSLSFSDPGEYIIGLSVETKTGKVDAQNL